MLKWFLRNTSDQTNYRPHRKIFTFIVIVDYETHFLLVFCTEYQLIKDRSVILLFCSKFTGTAYKLDLNVQTKHCSIM